MKAALVDWRLHVRQQLEVPDEDLFHIVGDWPNALCGADLSDRENNKRPLFELFDSEEPVCLGCVEADNRRRESKHPTA